MHAAIFGFLATLVTFAIMVLVNRSNFVAAHAMAIGIYGAITIIYITSGMPFTGYTILALMIALIINLVASLKRTKKEQ